MNRMTDEQRNQWVDIYQQYRRGGHGARYAAQIATGIVVDGLPF